MRPLHRLGLLLMALAGALSALLTLGSWLLPWGLLVGIAGLSWGGLVVGDAVARQVRSWWPLVIEPEERSMVEAVKPARVPLGMQWVRGMGVVEMERFNLWER